MKVLVSLLIGLLIIFNPAHAQKVFDTQTIWTEMGPGGRVIARLITAKSFCPNIIVDQTHTLPMSVRAGKSKKFNVTTCEATIPPYTQTAKINQQSLALPKKLIKRIVVLGDTGCRLKNSAILQACNDPNQWPFAKVAEQAAKSQPDLIIHVGDYYYREYACPANNKDCANSPFGDNWSSWKADFFKPAGKLLTTAPWIFVRGNHEDCNRGGHGWFRFLDPFKYSATCRPYSPLYSVSINDLNLFVLDSSQADDFNAPTKQVKIFSAYFQNLNHSNKKNIWLLSHKPVWFIADDKQTIKPYSTLQKALENNLSSQLNLILSGHIHRFETLNFSNGRPTQIISGNGGTRLDAEFVETLLQGFLVANNKVHQGISYDQFGYLTMEKTVDSWQAQERNADGKIIANCKLRKKQFTCLLA